MMESKKKKKHTDIQTFVVDDDIDVCPV